MRYAKALLRLATERHEDERVYAEMHTLAASFTACPTLLQALLNPVASAQRKQRLLTAAACADKEPTESTRRFLRLVVSKGRVEAMQLIALAYCTAYEQAHRIVNARLVVPATVSDDIIARLRAEIEQRTEGDIRFTQTVDPDIIGGYILEYASYRRDASLRTQLNRLRRQLAK